MKMSSTKRLFKVDDIVVYIGITTKYLTYGTEYIVYSNEFKIYEKGNFMILIKCDDEFKRPIDKTKFKLNRRLRISELLKEL
jgi:hypothetical protein